MKRFALSAGSGRTEVSLQATDTGQGLVILLTGGDGPHVGAVVLALPRPSLAGDGKPSCDTFILPVPGHKDYIPAARVAESVSKAMATPVAVCCGIHSDAMGHEEIALALSHVDALCRAFLEACAPLSP